MILVSAPSDWCARKTQAQQRRPAPGKLASARAFSRMNTTTGHLLAAKGQIRAPANVGPRGAGAQILMVGGNNTNNNHNKVFDYRNRCARPAAAPFGSRTGANAWAYSSRQAFGGGGARAPAQCLMMFASERVKLIRRQAK